MTTPAPEEELPRDPRIVRILAGGILLLCVGMALAVAGVVVGVLFLPGVIAIGIGHLVIGLAAVLRVARAAPAPAAS